MPLFLSVAFVAKIVRGEYRDKRKSYFRFDYAESYSIFVVTKIVKGERRDVKTGVFLFFIELYFVLYLSKKR